MKIDQTIRQAFPKLSENNVQAAAFYLADMINKQLVAETLPTSPLKVLFDRVPIPPTKSTFGIFNCLDPRTYEFDGYVFRKLCNEESFPITPYAIQVEHEVRGIMMVIKTVPINFADDYEGTVGDWLEELMTIMDKANNITTLGKEHE